MTEVLLRIPERGYIWSPHPTFAECIVIQLGRCELDTCQRLLLPGKKYCGELHRYAVKNQKKKDRS